MSFPLTPSRCLGVERLAQRCAHPFPLSTSLSPLAPILSALLCSHLTCDLTDGADAIESRLSQELRNSYSRRSRSYAMLLTAAAIFSSICAQWSAVFRACVPWRAVVPFRKRVDVVCPLMCVRSQYVVGRYSYSRVMYWCSFACVPIQH